MVLLPDEIDLFWSFVVVDCACDCWIWTGSKHPRGYGQFCNRRRKGFAHRVAYETWREPVHPDYELDHLCRVKACANPWHLEAVTHQENVLRGVGPPALNARKTHCKHGHEFTTENTYIFTGRSYVERLCRACNRRYCQARNKGAQ